jgi:non-ribosomal peptide synthetase component F
VWEIYGALLHTATVVVVPYLVTRSPADFADVVKKQHVTICSQTPSAFFSLMPYLLREPASFACLKYFILGGEKLEFTKLRPFVTTFGFQQPVLTNNLGNSETCVHYMYKAIRPQDMQSLECSNVGRPIPSSYIYVVLKDFQPAPVLVWGELANAGPQMGWGYWKRPGLTASRFVADPFSSVPGARMYLTGKCASVFLVHTVLYRCGIYGLCNQ